MKLRITTVLALLALAGCSTTGSEPGTYLIPDKMLNVSPSLTIPVESLVAGAIVLAVVDPLAPNWRIEESRVAPDRVQIALTKKRFTTGGDGEAEQIFHRHAEKVAARNGPARYRVLAFSEGIESEVLVARRVARGVIELLP